MIKIIKKEAYDFFEMSKKVDEVLNFKQRDAHHHFGGEYKDFWHWQLENYFSEMRNDSFQTLNVSLDENYIGTIANDPDDWRYKIQKVYNELFTEYADKEGNIDVWVSW